VISNARTFLEFSGKEKEENDKYVKELVKYFSNSNKKDKYVLVEDSVVELCQRLPEPVCMLDLRAKQ
jgi:hypothetical protein